MAYIAIKIEKKTTKNFRKKRLAEGRGGTIHEAQMEAARKALSKSDEYFPHIKVGMFLIFCFLKINYY